jgi:hypothetical protein
VLLFVPRFVASDKANIFLSPQQHSTCCGELKISIQTREITRAAPSALEIFAISHQANERRKNSAGADN